LRFGLGQGEGVELRQDASEISSKEVDEVAKASHNFLLPTADLVAGGDELKGVVLTV
jgi:hypothetical protein